MPGFASLDDLPYRHVLPRTAELSPAGRMAVGGCDLRDLAEEFGTPLYVFDEADFRQTARAFKLEFEARWPSVRVLYAAKAFLCTALARMVAESGLGMDVVSAGELAVARAAGFPAAQIYFHGNNKLPAELEMAVSHGGIGRVVVDNFYELETLDRIAGEHGVQQPVLLRVSPNVDPHTHAKTTTGVLDSKFGFAIATGDAERAVEMALEANHLDVRGLHVHLGSPIFETEPFEEAARVMCGFAARMHDTHGFEFREYSPGGGFALAYTRDQHPPTLGEYAEKLAVALRAAVKEHRLDMPSLHIEPGRALVGRSMMAVYTVGARKEIPGVRTYVSVDGGMADNIRPAIYGSKYEAVPLDRPLAAPEETVTLAGKYCESGDILIKDAEVPRFEPGELVGLPASGAYNLAMSSNYNLALRPPVVAVLDGKPRLLQRRETVDDLLARDVG
jgi:diaminopimelate decarboxylase